MDSSELWASHATFIRGIAEYFHWKFPEVLELEEKVSVAYIYAEKARVGFDPIKGSFKSYGGRAIARGVLKEINREIESKFKKNQKTFEIIYQTYPTAGFDGDQLDDNFTCNIDGVIQYQPESDYSLADKVGAYRAIAASQGGTYAWLQKVYGLSRGEVASIAGKSIEHVTKTVNDFRKKNK